MDGGVAVGIAQPAFDLMRLATGNHGQISAAIRGEPARQFTSIDVHDGYGVAALKAAVYRCNAGGQEAATFGAQRILSTDIHHDTTRRLGSSQDPALAIFQRRMQRREARADAFVVGGAAGLHWVRHRRR